MHLLGQKHQVTIKNLKDLQDVEKYMFNNLQSLNKSSPESLQESQMIKTRLDELSTTRMALFKQLKTMYKDQQRQTADSRGNLADQLTMTSVVKNELDNEEWGKIRSVVGIYSKGVLNNGSHLIDTIGYLLGDLRINVVTAKRIDYMPDDPTVDAAMYLKDSTPVNLIGTDSRDFTIFELHIYLEEGVISIEQSGLVIRRRKRLSDNIYLGYQKLQLESQEDLAQENPYIPVLDNLVDSIENQGILKSGIMNAFHTQLLCDDLINLF